MTQVISLLRGILAALGILQDEQQWGQLFVDLQTLLTDLGIVNTNVIAAQTETDIIGANMLTLQNTVTAGFNAVLDAVGKPLQAGEPVTLPTTAPAGYGGATAGAAANAVWDYVFPEAGIRAGDWGSDAASIQTNLTFNNTLWRLPNNPLIGYSFIQEPGAGFNVNATIFQFMPGPPGPLQGQLDYLTAAYPEASWFLANNDYYQTLDATDPDGQFVYTYLIPTWQWQMYAAGSTNAVKQAPVWPGLERVTLGSAVAIFDGVGIPGPLDGVLVAITGVPAPIGFYAFGAEKSFVRAGGIIFQTDNGDFEQAVPIGLEAQIICPTQMAQAVGAILRCPTGVTGTVTPFVVTS